MSRAKALPDSDLDGRFIFYWIALNALCGRAGGDGELGDLDGLLRQLRACDRTQGRIRRALHKLEQQAKTLLGSQFLYKKYWLCGLTDELDRKLQREREMRAWRSGTLEDRLEDLFRRLTVLRNQIFHGASTDRSRVNRDSLDAAVPLLSEMVKCFVELVATHQTRLDLGAVPDPPKNHEDHPLDKRQKFNPPHLGR